MADFAGTLKEMGPGAWQAAGLLSVSGGKTMFDTVCKPRMVANEAAGEAFLRAWAVRHNAAEIVISVERAGSAALDQGTATA